MIVCLYCNKEICGESVDIECINCNTYYRVSFESNDILWWYCIFPDYDLYFNCKKLRLSLFSDSSPTPFLNLNGEEAMDFIFRTKDSLLIKTKNLYILS